MSEEKKVNTWGDVTISPDMPLSALINFLNILNQRLFAIEDNYKVTVDGETISLTELYKRQAEEQERKMAEQANKKE